MLWIILWILTFVLLVILHELGHFIAAKKSWVQVKEFWLGMPPRIATLRTDKSGTKYTLNLIPLGGFVALKGEDGTNSAENTDANSFVKAKLRKKLIIISAGVMMNFLIARVVFSSLFFIGTKPISVLPDDLEGISSQSYLMPSISFLKSEGFLSGEIKDTGVVVEQVLSGSIAASLGIKSGAVLVDINGQPISTLTINRILSKLTNTKENTIHFAEALEMSSLQEGKFSCESDCKLGIVFRQEGDIEVLPVKFWLGKAMLAGFKEIKAERDLTMTSLWRIGSKLFSFNANDTKSALNQLTWPVGAVKFGEKLFDAFGPLIFLGFGGMLSLALAIFNILPIPAVDGGRFWAVILQKLFRISDEKFSTVEGRINFVFFRALMLLGVVIILKDLVFRRGIKIPFIG